MPLGLRVTQRAFEQRTSDPAAAKRRLDRQRAEQQRLGSPTTTGNCRTEPTSNVPIHAVNDRSSK